MSFINSDVYRNGLTNTSNGYHNIGTGQVWAKINGTVEDSSTTFEVDTTSFYFEPAAQEVASDYSGTTAASVIALAPADPTSSSRILFYSGTLSSLSDLFTAATSVDSTGLYLCTATSDIACFTTMELSSSSTISTDETFYILSMKYTATKTSTRKYALVLYDSNSEGSISGVLPSAAIYASSDLMEFPFDTSDDDKFEISSVTYVRTTSDPSISSSADVDSFALIEIDEDAIEYVDVEIVDSDATYQVPHAIPNVFNGTTSANFEIVLSGSLSSTQTLNANNSFSLTKTTVTVTVS